MSPSDAFLAELDSFGPGERIKLLTELLAVEVSNLFGTDFMTLELKISNGHVTDIRPFLNIKPDELLSWSERLTPLQEKT